MNKSEQIGTYPNTSKNVGKTLENFNEPVNMSKTSRQRSIRKCCYATVIGLVVTDATLPSVAKINEKNKIEMKNENGK